MSARAMARTHIRVTELVSHREMSPLKEVAPLNMSCSKTRCMSAGERAEFGVRAHALRRPPRLSTRMLPSAVHVRGLAPSSPQHPHASLGGTCTRTQKAEGIKDVKDTRCAPRWIHMSARAMARTSIFVTERVSHKEMSPLKEVAPLNICCSNTRSTSARARAEFGVRAHALRRPPHLSTRMLPSAVHVRGLRRRRESKMLGIRGVRQGEYICRQEPWHVQTYA